VNERLYSRRDFHRLALTAAGAVALPGSVTCDDVSPATEPTDGEFRLNYIVASCMYGTTSLEVIVPQVPLCGATHIELWAEPHGRQREELDEIGEERFLELLSEHDVELGGFTCFKHGIFAMQEEMDVVQRLGGELVICNSGGQSGLADKALHEAVAEFANDLRPHVEYAESVGVTIGLENHSGGLISSRESILWLLDLIPSPRLGLALAPSHLPQDEELISALILELGPRVVSFQAWEFGNGFIGERPKEEQLLQLPHRGPLDWTPMMAALRDIDYAGRVEIFMHPTPRGIPIHDTPAEVTSEINAARAYLEACLANA
jgi:sugar phosphate isomerase/epimerase